MEPGIFAKTFRRATLEETLDAVAAQGLRQVQFNWATAGLAPMPDRIDIALVARVRRETAARGIRIAAVSGTYNMIHPDPGVRADGFACLREIAATSRGIGSSVITLCTGTRDPDDMWRWHPANASPEAWRDLLASLAAALEMAEEHDVRLAFEPEPGNVINSAARARDLLRVLRSPRLGVVVDPANLIATDPRRPPEVVLDEAFDLLGPHVLVAHAKDRGRDGQVRTAGQGIVPWERYVALLRAARFDGPLILHGLAEDEVGAAVAFLGERIAADTQRS